MPRSPAFLAPLLLAFWACPSDQVGELSHDLRFTPAEVDLGIVFLDESRELEVRVENRGGGTASLVVDALPPGFEVKPEQLEVPGYSQRSLSLRFEAREEGAIAADLVMDAGRGEARLPLRVRVFASPFEGPDRVDFGVVRIGTAVEEELVIQNLLDEPVVLEHRWGPGGLVASYSFSGGVSIAPGASARLPIRFEPLDEAGEQEATLLLGCEGCPSKEVTLVGFGGEVELAFEPDPLSFEVPPLEVVEHEVRVVNSGQVFTGELSLSVEGAQGFSVEPTRLDSLGPEEWTLVFVSYEAPVDFGSVRAELVLRSDEGKEVGGTSLVANVLGTELDVRAPGAPLVAPVGWEGGPPYDWRLELLNLGTEPAVSIATEIRGPDAGAFRLEPVDDGILMQGEPEAYRLEFRPLRVGAFQASLVFRGGGSEAVFPLSAEGTRPIAACAELPEIVEVAKPLELRGWDESALGDGRCAWQVVEAPEGSLDRPASESDCATEFNPQLVGDYMLAFDVVDAAGNQDRCTTSFYAHPFDDLWVELYWSRESDVDLYLLNEALGDRGTAADWRSEATCYFANCKGALGSPPWGEPIHRPTLDVDDVSGRGPENIRIEETPLDAAYAIGVHWFHTRGQVRNDATVKVYCRGELQGSATITLEQHKVFYRVGQIVMEGQAGCSVTVDPIPWYGFGVD